MKTPRDLLLKRHEAALPQLDALRARARAGGFQPPSPASQLSTFNSQLPSLWERLFGPNPLAWAGLAAAWLVLLALNHNGDPTTRDASARAHQPSEAAVAEIVRERRREMAELLNLDEPRATQPARDALPPKRSHRREASAHA